MIMKHFYQNIHGWFGYGKLYSSMVAKFDNAKFVEVGCWKGRSASYMAVEIANSNKNIKFYCVDPWTGEAKIGASFFDCEEVTSKTLYECFLKNMEPVKDYIIPIRMLSTQASKQFEDESLDFVFIDASHDYDSVKEDINSWWPKIKIGGILAGHDYKFKGVNKAVHEFIDSHGLQLDDIGQGSWCLYPKTHSVEN